MSRVDISSGVFSSLSLPNGMLQTSSALSTTLQVVKDNLSNNSSLYLSTTVISFGADSGLYWDNTKLKLGIGMSGIALINNSAKLQIDSTTQGFLPPRMTEAQILAIVSPATGLICYNTDKDCPVFYSSIGWRKISHSAM